MPCWKYHPDRRRPTHEFRKNIPDRPTSVGPWVMGEYLYQAAHQWWNWWLSIGCKAAYGPGFKFGKLLSLALGQAPVLEAMIRFRMQAGGWPTDQQTQLLIDSHVITRSHMRSQSSHTHIQLTPTQAHVQISGPTVKPHKHHSNCCHCYQVDLLGFKLQSIAESKQIFTLKSSCSLPFVPTLTHGSQIHHVEHDKRQSFMAL